MKFFWQRKKKKSTENVVTTKADVVASIKYIVGGDNQKYLNINDFIALLTEYQKNCKDYTQIALLAQIITELKKAKFK